MRIFFFLSTRGQPCNHVLQTDYHDKTGLIFTRPWPSASFSYGYEWRNYGVRQSVATLHLVVT